MLILKDIDPEESLFTWEIVGNPDASMLRGSGPVVTCPDLQADYINVLTQKPIEVGVHYFQFVMHHIGDEQWCGVTSDASQAGKRVSGRCLKGCFYYSGRMPRAHEGALQQDRKFKSAKPMASTGTIIGMLVDRNQNYVAFDLNGEYQGSWGIPDEPVWILTHVDTPRDAVELRKLSVNDAPFASQHVRMNDEGAPVDYRIGRYYCGRRLGVAAIPNSDGCCGPNNGPQCASCKRYQDLHSHLSVPNLQRCTSYD